MDLRQLRYFTAVIEHKSLSAAAAHLKIAQPAITRSLRHLAEGLGVTLLERHGRGMRPTEAGERLYRHARQILSDLNTAELDVVEAEASPVGHVTFACTPAFGSVIVPPTLEKMRDRYPRIRVSVREGFSDTVYKWLLDAECDVAVVASPRSTPMIDIWNRWPRQMCVGVPGPLHLKRFPIMMKPAYQIADLAAMPMILPSLESSHRMVVESAVMAEGLALDVAYEVDGVSTIVEMVARGLGFTVLLESAMMQAVGQGLIEAVPFEPPGLWGELAIGTPTARQPSRASRLFINLLEETVNAVTLVPAT